MQEAHGGRLIGRRRFIQLGAAAGMTMFALGVTGCSPLPATSSAKSSYVPGAYTAQAQGKQSLVTVEVTFGENAIEAVEVLGHYESERIANTAISAITSDIVELQSLCLHRGTHRRCHLAVEVGEKLVDNGLPGALGVKFIGIGEQIPFEPIDPSLIDAAVGGVRNTGKEVIGEILMQQRIIEIRGGAHIFIF